MYAKYLSKLATIPARTAEWTGRLGPAALIGIDNTRNGSAARLHQVFQETALHSDSDWYHSVKWFEEGPIEAPPTSVPHLPILNCGVMAPEVPQDSSAPAPNSMEWFGGTMQATSILVEKGYVPVILGGDASITLAAVEGIRKTVNEEIVLLNFGADSRLSSPTSAARVLLSKGMLRGYLQIGGRGIDKEARNARKEFQCRYMDTNAVFARNIPGIRDLKNTYPIYLTIDLGVLDPAFAPGVPKPEPGGLSVRELLSLMHAIRGSRLLAVDIVGYDPRFDIKMGAHPFGLTELAAGKILKEAILKAYYTTTMSTPEGLERLDEMKKRGDAPTTYPEI